MSIKDRLMAYNARKTTIVLHNPVKYVASQMVVYMLAFIFGAVYRQRRGNKPYKLRVFLYSIIAQVMFENFYVRLSEKYGHAFIEPEKAEEADPIAERVAKPEHVGDHSKTGWNAECPQCLLDAEELAKELTDEDLGLRDRTQIDIKRSLGRLSSN